jgi:hypothetical protein
MAMGIRKVGDDSGSVYDTEWYKESVVKAERGNREHIAKFDRSFLGIMAKADDADGDETGRDDGDGDTNHPIVQLATILVASGKFPDHAQALHHLLNTSHGNALVARLKAADQTAKESNMDKIETVRDVVKRHGIVAVAKSIVDENRSYGITEHEFVELATEHAKAQHPDLTEAAAFAKIYQTPEVWRACNVLKSMPFVADVVPLVVGGESAQAVNDPSEAIAQLKQLGARKWPTATEAQQFERALTAPEHHALARRAVPIPRATTSYPWPR